MYHKKIEIKKAVIAVLVSLCIYMPANTSANQKYNEAPMLAERVVKGNLPPVEDRLPEEPLVIKPVESVGKYGGTWHMGMKKERDHAVFIRYADYENLLRWDPGFNYVIPNVAESYTVNRKATIYTFNLRKGIKWSDGQPFTADDIMFWYEDVIMNKELTPKPPGSLIVEGELVKVIKKGNHTVLFAFEEPYGLFPQILAQAHTVDCTTCPKHYLKQFHIKYNPDINNLAKREGYSNWVELFKAKLGKPGSVDDPSRWQNPALPTLNAWVQLNSYTSDIKKVVSERNPYYWKVDSQGNQLPYIDRIERTLKETAEEIADMAVAGQIDMQRRRMDARSKEVLESGMQNHSYHLFKTTSTFSNTMVISLNLTHEDLVKRQIFQNKDFRIGLSYAINRQKIVDKVLNGQGKPYQVAPRPESEFYDNEFSTQYTVYNPKLACSHLDQAGYSKKDSRGFRLGPDGKRISFVVEHSGFSGNETAILELVQKYWEEVGIEIKIKEESRKVMYERKDNNKHDAVCWLGDGGMEVILEPRWYFPYSSESNYAPLWQKWYNKEPGGEKPPVDVVRQMISYDQLKVTGNEKLQKKLMRQVLEISKNQFYAIGISLPTTSYGVVKNNFHNVPEEMPYSWIYPTPAPTNTCQYYINEN